MNKTYQIAAVLLAVSLLAIFVKNELSKRSSVYDSGTPSSKDDYINIIINSKNASNAQTLKTFEDDYVRAWADAVVQLKPTFVHKGVIYRVKGGTRV